MVMNSIIYGFRDGDCVNFLTGRVQNLAQPLDGDPHVLGCRASIAHRHLNRSMTQYLGDGHKVYAGFQLSQIFLSIPGEFDLEA